MATFSRKPDIGQIRETEQNIDKCQMCKKNDAKAEYFCNSCQILICQTCADLHATAPVLKSHNVVQIEINIPIDMTERCKRHEKALDYFCPLCEDVLCVACLCEPEHDEHHDKVLDYQTGIEQFKKSLTKSQETLREKSMLMAIGIKMVTEESCVINEIKKRLSAKSKDLEELQNKLRDQLATIDDLGQADEFLNEKALELMQQLQNHMEETEEINILNKSEYVPQAKEWRAKCSKLTENTNLILGENLRGANCLSCNIKIPDIAKLEIEEKPLREKVEMFLESAKRQDIRKVEKREGIFQNVPQFELMLDFKDGSDVIMGEPCEAEKVGDGTIILVDTKLSYIQRINIKGDVIKKYHMQFNVKSASAYKNFLFVVEIGTTTIKKVSLETAEIRTIYNPNENFDYICAGIKHIIIISVCEYEGQIFEFNTKTKTIVTKVPKIIRPGKVCVDNSSTQTKYIVGSYEPSGVLSLDPVVFIYNASWSLNTSLKTSFFSVPHGLTMTDNGNLLIADKKQNCVFVYHFDGKYVTRVVGAGQAGLNEPVGIAYHQPYLWIIQANPRCLKLLLLDVTMTN